MLLLGVAFLVGIDLVILLSYTLVEGLNGRLGSKLIENAEKPRDEQGVRTIVLSILCKSGHLAFLGIAVQSC